MTRDNISVIKIDDILMVSVPSDPSDGTVTDLQHKILKAMADCGAKGLVMDISTVDTLDSYFARTIVETAEMVKLMGGPTVIAGMQPTVAITATQLGLTFGRLLTALDMDHALYMLKTQSFRRKRANAGSPKQTSPH